MSSKKIVIVEDELDILEVLVYNLEREGFEVLSTDHGTKGLELITTQKPDLVVLDLMLPGMDGLEICQKVRANDSVAATPIIMLTAKSEESDVVLGLGLGADDYLSKPFSPKVLVARIKAMLRRSKTTEDKIQPCINCKGLTIDGNKYKVTFNGDTIKLTATEFRLLQYLAQHPGQVFSREQIMNNAYGSEVVVVDRNIDVHIRAIRKKIGEEHNFIETIRGIGYSFVEN